MTTSNPVQTEELRADRYAPTGRCCASNSLFGLAASVLMMTSFQVTADCQVVPPGTFPLSSFDVVECSGTVETNGVFTTVSDVTVNVLSDGVIDTEERRAVNLGTRGSVIVESGGLISAFDDRALNLGFDSDVLVRSGGTIEMNKSIFVGSEFAVVLGGESSVTVEQGGVIQVIKEGGATSDAIVGGTYFSIAGSVLSTGNYSDCIDIPAGEIIIAETGIVRSDGINSDGIDSDWPGSTLLVDGSITALGPQSTAAQLGSDGLIVVSSTGSISTTDPSSNAISASSTRIENAGVISSVGTAIRGSGAMELVNLGAVVGDILLQQGDDTVYHDASVGEFSGLLDAGEDVDHFFLTGGTFDLTQPTGFEGFTIESGANGLGAGTISALEVRANGTLSPGASIGSLTIAGDFHLAEGGLIDAELDSSAMTADLLVVDEAAHLDGTLEFDLLEGVPFELDGATFNVVEAAGGITGAAVLNQNDVVASGISGLDVVYQIVDAASVPSVIEAGEVLQATFVLSDLIFENGYELAQR